MERISDSRKLIAESNGLPYVSVDTISEAKRRNGFYLVMDGDDSGQIYLSCPIHLVKCDEEILQKILAIIDRNQWGNFDPTMCGYYFELHQADGVISGGMGGGVALQKDLWIHHEISVAKEVLKKIIMDEMDSKSIYAKMDELKMLLPSKK